MGEKLESFELANDGGLFKNKGTSTLNEVALANGHYFEASLQLSLKADLSLHLDRAAVSEFWTQRVAS